MAMVLGVSCVAVTGSLTWQLSVVEAVASMVLVTNISFYFFLNLCDTYMLLFRISGVWEEMWLMCQYSVSISVQVLSGGRGWVNNDTPLNCVFSGYKGN